MSTLLWTHNNSVANICKLSLQSPAQLVGPGSLAHYEKLSHTWNKTFDSVDSLCSISRPFRHPGLGKIQKRGDHHCTLLGFEAPVVTISARQGSQETFFLSLSLFFSLYPKFSPRELVGDRLKENTPGAREQNKQRENND